MINKYPIFLKTINMIHLYIELFNSFDEKTTELINMNYY